MRWDERDPFLETEEKERHMKSIVSISAIAALAGVANAGVLVAGTSFENAFVGAQYMDTGDASMDHDLINNAGQSVVDFTADGTEMGFDAYYRNTRNSNGLTDGDFVGATDFTGAVGSFTDGTQGYQMSDADGTMGVQFDTVMGADSVSFDLFVNESGWESDDSVRAFVVVDGGVEFDIFNTIGSDIDNLFIEGSWMNLSFDISAYSEATLVVELESNASLEAIYLDNVQFRAIPTPGSVALLAIGGLVGTRRRRA
jgi:hypothetical protein